MQNSIVGGRFQIKSKIGAGSFGEIYAADDLKMKKEVAIKIDLPKDKTNQLSFESKVYSILEGANNIPEFYWYGSIGRKSCGMAIELLGKSLQERFAQCNHRFSLKTVLMLADQMLSTIEYIHTRHFIHRDLKPDNFVLGLDNKSNQLYVIDFGLSKKYRDPKTLEHIPYFVYKELTGTARYASIHALRGIEQSRRDDLESLGYMWIYFLKGYLPWMGIDAKDNMTKNNGILKKKQATSIEELCEGFPDEFAQYFRAIRHLKFSEKPNYTEYRKIFRDLFMAKEYIFDYDYDWNKMPASVSQSSTRKNKLPLKQNLTNFYQLPDTRPEVITKKTPIIHNTRLVPNYETGKKLLINQSQNQNTNIQQISYNQNNGKQVSKTPRVRVQQVKMQAPKNNYASKLICPRIH